MPREGNRPHLRLESELRDYLTQVLPVMGGASSFGAQLERAARYAFGCQPCLVCGGNRATGKPGCGFVVGSEQGTTERQRSEQRRKRELSAVSRAFFLEIGEDPDELEPLRDTTCPACGGVGFTPRRSPYSSRGAITARPVGCSVPVSREGGYTLAETALDLGCLAAGRYLAELRGLDAAAGTRHALVLEVWIEHRSEVPLWLLTPSGPALVRRAGLVVDDARDLEHLLKAVDNERAADAANPSTERTRLLRACAEDARRLLREAAYAWNELVGDDEEDEDMRHEKAFCRAVGL